MSDTKERPPADALVPAIGAVVFASDEPVGPRELSRALGGVEAEEIQQAIDALEKHYESHPTGLRIERVAGGIQLATQPEVGAWVRRFFRHRNRTRLSPPALETLAIVAYRQPVTSPEIQAIRAKDPTAAIKGLLEKKLIRCLGRKKVVGSPLMYGTSKHFLEHFGLDSLGDLPSIDEFGEFLEALDDAAASAHSPAAPADGEA